jgi:hypothetical protein
MICKSMKTSEKLMKSEQPNSTCHDIELLDSWSRISKLRHRILHRFNKFSTENVCKVDRLAGCDTNLMYQKETCVAIEVRKAEVVFSLLTGAHNRIEMKSWSRAKQL